MGVSKNVHASQRSIQKTKPIGPDFISE